MDGAIGLAVDTVNEIETRGITMSDEDKSKLVTNILTVSVVKYYEYDIDIYNFFIYLYIIFYM